MTKPPCPDWLPVVPENIPQELKERPQWVAWRPVFRDGKWTKCPVNAKTGHDAKSNTPATWSSFDAALAYHRAHPWDGNGTGTAGIGYVLAADDPFVGVDIDHCIVPGQVFNEFGVWVMEQLASYTEISPSGTGLRIFIKGKLPKDGRKKGTFECYEAGRFLTMTGELAMPGEPYLDAIHERQTKLEDVHARIFAPKEQPKEKRHLSDHELLALAYKSKNGREIERLMGGDTSGHQGDDSAADLALCNALAFWTDKDANRMDRIFRSSGLFRPKWDEKHYANGATYGQGTIAKAIDGTRDTYGQGRAGDKTASTGEGYNPRRDEQQINAQADANDKRKAQQWASAREIFPRTAFPWDVLPEDIAVSFQQLARSCAGSPNPIPGAAFAIIAAALGRTLAVTPKHGWTEPAIVWHGDIRESGSGKTAPLKLLASALVAAQRAEDDRARDAQAEYDALPAKEKKNAEPPKQARTYWCSDVTMEGLRAALHDHPTGGVVVILSELSAIISGQNQYKKQGNDREALLCLHDGTDARIVRAGKPAIAIRDARVSIIGGIQPGVFKSVFGGQKGQFLEDGTISRFIFCYEPPAFYPSTPESWGEDNAAAWSRIVNAALRWADAQEGNHPVRMILSQEAQGVFFDWVNETKYTRQALPQGMARFLAKAHGYSLRLAGIIHAVRQFAQGLAPSAMLDADDMRRGIAAVNFYLGQALDALATMDTEDVTPPVEVSERTQTLAATLEDLRTNVDSGRLAVGYVLEKYNAKASESQKIKAAKGFGAFLRGCGLTVPTTKHHANGRAGVYCLTWDKRLEDFLRTLRTCEDEVLNPAGKAQSGFEDFEDFEDLSQEEKKTKVPGEAKGDGDTGERGENIYPQSPQSPQSQETSQPEDEDQVLTKSSPSPQSPQNEEIQDEVEI